MKLRFVIGIGIILAMASYLGYKGFESGQDYYYFCNEVAEMGSEAIDVNMKMHGEVVEGSIDRDGDIVRAFDLEYEGARFNVQYVGTDPVPDTFKAGIEAVVDGHLTSDGHFQGAKIQAKCASKYEAEYDVDDIEGNTAR